MQVEEGRAVGREEELERKEKMGHLHSAIRQMEGLVYKVKKWNEFVKEKHDLRSVKAWVHQ